MILFTSCIKGPYKLQVISECVINQDAKEITEENMNLINTFSCDECNNACCSDGEPCKYLLDNKCGIYDKRPRPCISYPFRADAQKQNNTYVITITALPCMGKPTIKPVNESSNEAIKNTKSLIKKMIENVALKTKQPYNELEMILTINS